MGMFDWPAIVRAVANRLISRSSTTFLKPLIALLPIFQPPPIHSRAKKLKFFVTFAVTTNLRLYASCVGIDIPTRITSNGCPHIGHG
jgi:hypothetical protein